MVPRDNGTDIWDGNFRPTTKGDWSFSIATYSDILATWRHRAEIKIPAGVDVSLNSRRAPASCPRAEVPDRTKC